MTKKKKKYIYLCWTSTWLSNHACFSEKEMKEFLKLNPAYDWHTEVYEVKENKDYR